MGDLLKGRVALVTGGGRGIGKATARCLAQEGTEIIICSRSESELKGTVAEIKRQGGSAAYPEEDPVGLKMPEEVAEVIVRLILDGDMSSSGKSFDSGTVLAEGIRK